MSELIRLAHLELTWAIRHGWASAGAFGQERRFLDFVVDGRSLLATLGGGDFVTPFGWLPSVVEERAAHRLLLAAPALLADRRQELYVCPECADLGCGALTAVVERADDRIIWRNFGYQRDPSVADVDRDRYAAVGLLAFERAAYERTIRAALRRSQEGQATN